MTEAVISTEIQALRDHVETRFASLERWLERVTLAVEKQGENRERLIVLETRYQALERQVADNDKRVESKLDGLAKKTTEDREQIIRFGVYFAIAGTALTIAVPILVKMVLP